MTISTLYSIGDKISVGGKSYTIRSVHLYKSDKKQTERYYLGNILGKQLWVAISR